MPKKVAKFIVDNSLAENEFEELKTGHIPQEMEDKWFSYFDSNKLFIHKSWSGFCIYIVEFKGNELMVTVNRDKKQYNCKDIEMDKQIVNSLLHGVLRC